MADLDFSTDDAPLEPGPETETDEEADAPTEPTTETSDADRLTADGAGPDPNDPNYKYWQAAYTKTRQRDRERLGSLEQEHKQYGDVLRNFYQSDEYALQVLRQRFPQLASKLSLDGTPTGTHATGTPTGTAPTSSGVVHLLEQQLGSDLAFLAPRIGPAIEAVIKSALTEAVTPIQRQSEQRAAQERKRMEDQVLAEMDAQFPGWEPRYGSTMQELDRFLASDELTHPKFGSRHQLLIKLANPDLARIDATRAMERAGRTRLTTGRAGRPSQPNTEQQVREAKSNSDAFRLAAEAAINELRRGA